MPRTTPAGRGASDASDPNDASDANDANDASGTIYRLRASILGIEPEIWRLIEVDGRLRLDEFHDALQLALGWRDSHLHLFTEEPPEARFDRPLPRVGRLPREWHMAAGIDEVRFDREQLPGPASAELLDETEFTLAHVFESFDGPLYYEYDFGDGWQHLIELIEVLDVPIAEADAARALVIRGERRAPLEDSGGPYGYGEVLEALADPTHPDHADRRQWVDATTDPWTDFDPERFDADAANRELALRFGAATETSGLIPDASGPTHPTSTRSSGSLDAASALQSGSLAAASVWPSGSLDAASPLVDLVARLRPGDGAGLRGLVAERNLIDTERPDDETLARMVRPFSWLLDAVGPNGLTLTQAGWMPPAVVLDGMTTLGWRDEWIGASNREDITWPMRSHREAATRMGLIRKLKGRLLITALGKRAAADPVVLWEALARGIRRLGRSDAEADATTLLAIEVAAGRGGGFDVAARAVRAGLELLGYGVADAGGNYGYEGHDGYGGYRNLDERDAMDLIRASWHVFDSLSAFEYGDRRLRRGGEPTPDGRAFARAVLRGGA